MAVDAAIILSIDRSWCDPISATHTVNDQSMYLPGKDAEPSGAGSELLFADGRVESTSSRSKMVPFLVTLCIMALLILARAQQITQPGTFFSATSVPNPASGISVVCAATNDFTSTQSLLSLPLSTLAGQAIISVHAWSQTIETMIKLAPKERPYRISLSSSDVIRRRLGV